MTQLSGFASFCPQGRARHRSLLAIFLVSAGICLCFDQLGKGWAFASWRAPVKAVQILPGLFAGAQARNYGGMYSLEGQDTPFVRGILAFVGFVVLGMVFRWVFVLDRDRWCHFDAGAGGLLVAGALGNQVDRLTLGYVRDYILLGFQPSDIFNTADVFMVFGAIMLLGSLIIRRQNRIARV